MQKRIKLQQHLLIATCAAAMGASTGCRSAMPKWSLFGSRNTPSAEMLAGEGPTITYPTPPSESASPTAIASVAGGTAEPSAPQTRLAAARSTAPAMGFDVGAKTIANTNPAPSMAAAGANGFQLASSKSTTGSTAGQLPSYGTPSSVSEQNSDIPAIPTGYQFGTRRTAPTGSTTSSSPPSTSGYAMPGGSATAPSAGTSAVATTASNGGFTLPQSVIEATDAPSAAQPFTPKTPGTATAELALPTGAASSTPSAGITLPGSSGSSGGTPASTVSTGSTAPSFSTASAALAPRASEPIRTSLSDGYAPGSTANSDGYPTTSGYPSPSNGGSFYR